MSFNKFIYKDGVWIAASTHNTSTEPTKHDLSEGCPAGFCHSPSAGGSTTTSPSKLDSSRRYDRAGQSQVRNLIQEDEARWAKQRRDKCENIVKQSIQDLNSGKVQVHDSAIHNAVKSFEDDRGRTHIVGPAHYNHLVETGRVPTDS